MIKRLIRRISYEATLYSAVLALLIALTTIIPLAYASPADPTWIAGIYDNADYDDVVSFLTDKTDASSGQVAMLGEQSSIAWMTRPRSGRIPQGTTGVENSRGPPVKSCDGSINFQLNPPVFSAATRPTLASWPQHPMAGATIAQSAETVSTTPDFPTSSRKLRVRREE